MKVFFSILTLVLMGTSVAIGFTTFADGRNALNSQFAPRFAATTDLVFEVQKVRGSVARMENCYAFAKVRNGKDLGPKDAFLNWVSPEERDDNSHECLVGILGGAISSFDTFVVTDVQANDDEITYSVDVTRLLVESDPWPAIVFYKVTPPWDSRVSRAVNRSRKITINFRRTDDSLDMREISSIHAVPVTK